MEEAIENLGVEKRKLIIEEQVLSELKSEMEDYQEDIEDFRKVRSSTSYLVCFSFAQIFLSGHVHSN